MKKRFVLLIICAIFSYFAQGQTCNPGGPAGTYNFFTSCQGGASFSGTNYSLQIGNNKTVVINGDVTLTGTLTITLVGSTSRLLIADGFTLTAANINFSGSATGKVVEVEGPSGELIVSGTLNFGGLDIELDGEGSITASSITGAANVSCTSGVNGGTGTCPFISAGSCDDGGSGLCSDPALPIELGSFSLSPTKNTIKITWTTLSEINNEYFTILRSVDGINYESIATLPGAGNSEILLSYSYTDYYPSFGKSYYRLKQTDFDGASETFKPVAVDFTSLRSGDLVFTNPINRGEKLRILTLADQKETLEFSLVDMMGRLVVQQKFKGSTFETDLDSSLKPGIYFVKISSSVTERIGRLVVK